MDYPTSTKPLVEPIFEEKPLAESSWGNLVALLMQVNRPKAELLTALYGKALEAYRKYQQVKAEKMALYAQQREEDLSHNAELQAQIAQLEQELRQMEQDYQQAHRARYEAWEQAYLQARIEAGKYGLNLAGERMFSGDEETSPHIANGSGNTPNQGEVNPSPAVADPPPPAPLSRLPRLFARTPVPNPSAALVPASAGNTEAPSAPAPQEPDAPLEPMTLSEAVVEQSLPTVESPPLHPWLWWLLVVIVGAAMGWLVATALGIEPTDWQNPVLWVGIVCGVASSLLLSVALSGAAAVVGELYHLFTWQERKSARVAWLIGSAMLVLLGLVVSLTYWLVAPLWLAGRSAPLQGVILSFIGIMGFSMMAVALLQGFLSGRRKWAGHQIAARLKRAEREWHKERQERARRQAETAPPNPAPPVVSDPPPQATAPPDPPALSNGQHPPETETSTDSVGANGGAPPEAPAPTQPNATALPPEVQSLIARSRALHQILKKHQEEFEKQRDAKLEQIRLLKQQLRPIYPDLSPPLRQEVEAARRVWAQHYTHFLETLAQALAECKDGEGLADSVRHHRQEILNTYQH
ncbi:MAG: hypothetical protein KatS3mg021_2727 [Fimbriimonadales bacterium]|nr:MAG: hypothetical protein KatS3mg021_2727 [Fimbriimonadales bacterium]